MTAQARPTKRSDIARLIGQFDRPGPRYTSYPTALDFHDGVTADQYKVHLREAAKRPDEPLSIYIHLPFCDERCLFCGCHVIISPDKAKASPYLDLLEREIDLIMPELGERKKVSQLHLGGGTPTYQTPEQLDRLMNKLEENFVFTDDCEKAVEVDPRVTTREHLAVLAKHGFNRISLGVQDLTPEVQEAIHRIQSKELTSNLVKIARELGFKGVNVDLIYGLPNQTVETFEKTVQSVIDMGCDRAAVYSFAYVPWVRGHQKMIETAALPEPEEKAALFGAAREVFLKAGFEPIGMDHFALPTDELAKARMAGRLRRNFQGYAVIPATDVIGLGISAIGDVGGLYVQNAKKLTTYRAAIEAGELSAERGVEREGDDELRRAVIHDLMCNFKIDVEAHEKRFGIDFMEYFAPDLKLLEPLVEEGLAIVGPKQVEATPIGELFVRNLAICFDRRIREQKESSGPSFSQTV
ncbi:MAG: oxygen-independent coproporphyrinogen III oxidase [Planctomycetes bacterium]|nr:oxygen-independent coproporphyrinogen III oxidase [Planctomycetota bacterium]